MKKEIIFITASLGFGGAEKMLVFVANQLSYRGHEISIINLNSVPSYVNGFNRNVSDKIIVHTLDKSISGHKNKIKKIVKIVKDTKADVLIGFTEYPSLYAKIVGMLLHIPSIMSERGDPFRTNGRKNIKNRISAAIVGTSKGGVFQTEGAKAFYSKGLQKRGVVIPNPIFITEPLPDVPFEQRENTVVSVGRLDNVQKRYDVMLRSFALFSEKYPQYKLKIYGDGNDKKRIEDWAKEYGIADKVLLMGLVKKPMQEIAKDKIFLITSDYEGISNSLLEAMAVGLSCVSTDHTPGGARLLINDQENGLLAPMGDEEAIANCLIRYVTDKDLAKKCGLNAKDVVNRFSVDRIINDWECYILKICR